MATVDKAFADRLIAGSGWVGGNSDNSMGDNPRCRSIVEYENAWGGTSYGCVFDGERDLFKYMRPSEYVQNPRVYWEAA